MKAVFCRLRMKFVSHFWSAIFLKKKNHKSVYQSLVDGHVKPWCVTASSFGERSRQALVEDRVKLWRTGTSRLDWYNRQFNCSQASYSALTQAYPAAYHYGLMRYVVYGYYNMLLLHVPRCLCVMKILLQCS